MLFILIVILGWHYPLLGFFIPLCMLLGLGIGFGRGRKWCDWYCPRGSFFDALASRLSPQKKIPRVFRNIYFRIGVLAFLMAIMAYNLIVRWPSPYSIGTIVRLAGSSKHPLEIKSQLCVLCKSCAKVCPIQIKPYLYKGKGTRAIKDKDCLSCGLCVQACPRQALSFSYKEIS